MCVTHAIGLYTIMITAYFTCCSGDEALGGVEVTRGGGGYPPGKTHARDNKGCDLTAEEAVPAETK